MRGEYRLSDLPAELRNMFWVNGFGCWIWRGRLNRNGYGRAGRAYGERVIHRVVYEHLVGSIPPGQLLDHLRDECSSRACANPDHLEPVTPRINVRRGEAVLFTPARLGWLHSRGMPRDFPAPDASACTEEIPW